jgi:hypothetical protein
LNIKVMLAEKILAIPAIVEVLVLAGAGLAAATRAAGAAYDCSVVDPSKTS